MSIIDNGQVTGSFQGSSSAVPLCGIILNEYEKFDNLGQFKYSGATQCVAGNPVTVLNQSGGTSTANIDGINSVIGEVTAIATTVALTSGFLAQSQNDIVPAVGGEAIPNEGLFSKVSLLGSGLKMWLKVKDSDTTLSAVNMNTPVSYDFTANTGGLIAQGAKDTALPVSIHSALTDAKYLNWNNSTGKAVWTACKAILVSFDGNYMVTIEPE